MSFHHGSSRHCVLALCTIIMLLSIGIFSHSLSFQSSKHSFQRELNHPLSLEEEIEKSTLEYQMHLANEHKRMGLLFEKFSRPQTIRLVSMQETLHPADHPFRLATKAHKMNFTSLHSEMSFLSFEPTKYRIEYPLVPTTWLKLAVLRDLILNDTHKEYEWYMWVDSDIVFTNSSCTFQELLSTNHRVIFSHYVNTGVMFIRNHPWSVDFLDAWFATRNLAKTYGMEDETIASLLYDPKWGPYVYLTPLENSHRMQSIATTTEKLFSWHPGHCILHPSGFWLEKDSIMMPCMHSEYDCVQRLNELYVSHNGSGYLPVSEGLNRFGWP